LLIDADTASDDAVALIKHVLLQLQQTEIQRSDYCPARLEPLVDTLYGTE